MWKKINVDVAVIGAGISGLATAHFLKKQGVKTVVLEKNNRPGGSIQTVQQDGFLIEYGPNSTLDTSPILHELFRDLGIESELEYANEHSKNRYIVRSGKLHPLPLSPGAFLKTRLFSTSAKLRLLKEPFIKASDPTVEESLADFVQRRLGREFLDFAIDPFVAGVYAGLPEQLSVQIALPKLYALEQNYGSLIKGTILGIRERKKRQEVSKQSARLFSFRRGMQQIIDQLQQELGENLFLQVRLESLRSTSAGYQLEFTAGENAYHLTSRVLLFTIPAHAYADFGNGFFDPLQPTLKKIAYPPVSMVFLGFRSNPVPFPLDGFGFLVPRKENRQILGTIWSSTIFENRAPAGGVALTTFVGGSRQPENALLPEDRLVELVRNDLRELMGIEQPPDLAVVKQWPRAIPQYNLGYGEVLRAFEAFEAEHPGVFLSGNFRGGISVGDCVKQAKTFAEKIEQFLGSVTDRSEEVLSGGDKPGE